MRKRRSPKLKAKIQGAMMPQRDASNASKEPRRTQISRERTEMAARKRRVVVEERAHYLGNLNGNWEIKVR
jgi:hypothetical protein